MWLEEMLTVPPSPGVRRGVDLLGVAVDASLYGRRQESLAQSLLAERAFAATGTTAGLLRARLERVYALQRAIDKSCLEAGRGLAQQLASRKYRWAAVQALLNEYTCFTMRNDKQHSYESLSRAQSWSNDASYPVLRLRALGFAASYQVNRGKFDAGWKTNLQGLVLYWENQAPPIRAFQFYSSLLF